MATETIVPIRNVDQLKKVLFLQKVITAQAKKELVAIAQDALIPDNPEGTAEEFMMGERTLLEKYASYPTLTEHKLQPTLANAAKWGATFGVTLLVGELVLQQVQQMGQAHFAASMRHLYVVLLSELNLPKHAYLIEPLEKAVHVKVRATQGQVVTAEQEKAYIRSLVFALADAMLSVSVTYGMVISKEDAGYKITPLGRRVLMHLIDAGKFVDEMAVAHQRFQKVKAKLSMG